MSGKQANVFTKRSWYQQGHHASGSGQGNQTECQLRVKGENPRAEPGTGMADWQTRKGRK